MLPVNPSLEVYDHVLPIASNAISARATTMSGPGAPSAPGGPAGPCGPAGPAAGCVLGQTMSLPLERAIYLRRVDVGPDGDLPRAGRLDLGEAAAGLLHDDSQRLSPTAGDFVLRTVALHRELHGVVLPDHDERAPRGYFHLDSVRALCVERDGAVGRREVERRDYGLDAVGGVGHVRTARRKRAASTASTARPT